MYRKVSVFILFSVFLTGCATPYQPDGFTGGYTEKPLKKNVWKVNFSGNGFTSGERTETYALYRAAELTKEQGYDYFVIVKSNNYTSESTYTTPETTTGTATTSGSVNTYGDYGTYSGQTTYSQQTTGGQTYEIEKPGTTLVIHMRTGETPKDNPRAIDANFILNQYEPKLSGS